MTLTATDKKKYFRYHNQNKKSLENAIRLIKTDIKNSYKKELTDNQYILKTGTARKEKIQLLTDIRSYNRILFGLMVSWSDESIRRLYYESNVFSDVQIDYLMGARALEQKWSLALKIAFCKAYNIIPTGNDTCQGLTHNSPVFQGLDSNLLNKYIKVKDLIDDFLIPSFNIRNKVQHGEWIYAFQSPDSKQFDRNLTTKIFKENIVTISSRMTIFNSVYQMIIDLARFNSGSFKIDSNTTPFEFFYSKHLKKVEHEIEKINNPKLSDYVNSLIVKSEKGKRHKKEKHLTMANKA